MKFKFDLFVVTYIFLIFIACFRAGKDEILKLKRMKAEEKIYIREWGWVGRFTIIINPFQCFLFIPLENRKPLLSSVLGEVKKEHLLDIG